MNKLTMYRVQFRASVLLAVLPFHLLDPRRDYALAKETKAAPYNLNLITDKYSKLREKYQAPKYPIVLCHGLLGFDTLTLFKAPSLTEIVGKEVESAAQKVSNSGIVFNYWHGIEEALTKAGATVITAKVPPFGTIEQRAQLLDALLTEKCKNFPGRKKGERLKINLVGHSMGGLDSRYLISKLQTKDSPYQVMSLTTVGTPHHGSECADFLMDIVNKGEAFKGITPSAIPELTCESLKKFNQEVENDPTVSYFSYGALMEPQAIQIFRGTYEIIKREILRKGGTHVENDGMVSVESARWGQYMGTLHDVDHLDLINWTNRVKAAVDIAMFALPPAFNPIALYLDIAETLSKRNF